MIDRPTPATQNGLENVIRSWPKWMFRKAPKKHKLCSSWSINRYQPLVSILLQCLGHDRIGIPVELPQKILTDSSGEEARRRIEKKAGLRGFEHGGGFHSRGGTPINGCFIMISHNGTS